MADLVSGAIITSDQRGRACCPACFQLIKWEPSTLDRGSYRAVHKECGLQFHALVANYKVLVLDDDGNELGPKLEPVSVPAPPPSEAEQRATENTELVPGGLVLVKTGQPGE